MFWNPMLPKCHKLSDKYPFNKKKMKSFLKELSKKIGGKLTS